MTVARRDRRGFTLLETAIVLAITAIGALLVLPQWPSALTTDRQTDEAPGASLARELAAARRHAIASRQQVDVRLDVLRSRLRADTAGAYGRGVWRDTVLPLDAGEMLVTNDTAMLVRFLPSGASQSGRMTLRHPYGWVAITVDPWSGEVHRVAR